MTELWIVGIHDGSEASIKRKQLLHVTLHIEEDTCQILSSDAIVDSLELFDALFRSLVNLVLRLTLAQQSGHFI